ncbi:hypothetical protein D3C79_958350 [compost metagenome]
MLFNLTGAGGVQQVIGVELVVIDTDVLMIDAFSVQPGDRAAFHLSEAEQGDADITLRTGGQIVLQRAAHGLPVGKWGLVKAVEIKLEAFGFNQVEAVGVEANLAHRDLR